MPLTIYADNLQIPVTLPLDIAIRPFSAPYDESTAKGLDRCKCIGIAQRQDKSGQDAAPGSELDDVLKRRDDDAACAVLKQRCAEVFSMFPDGLDRSNIEPWILALEKEDLRAIFQARYREFHRALEQLLPDPRALNYLGDFAWLRRVRREMLVHYQAEDTALPDCTERVRDLINRHVKGEEVRVLLPPIPILSDRFSEEIEKLQSPRAKASRMEHAVKRTITVKMAEVRTALSKVGVSRSLGRQAIEIARQQGRFTVFNMVDALTRLSRQIVNAGDRTVVDQQAGNLLTLAV